MDRVSIKALSREDVGKTAARRMRESGQVPAVVYGHGKETMNLTIDVNEMNEIFASGTYSTHIFDLEISDGKKSLPSTAVMIKEVQRHPIKGTLLNIDLHAISLTEKVTAQVPVFFVGEPEDVKHGGILERLHQEIQVSCLPTKIPEHLEVDISEMKIGESIHASSLVLPEDVELMTSGEEVLLVLAAPKIVEEAPAEAEEAGAEAAEPEVISQKGESTEEEA